MSQPTSPEQFIRSVSPLRLFLIGFMGSGKTYTANRLAKLLGMPVFDIDDWITSTENRTIASIFSDSGEDFFRQIESKQLRETAQLPLVVVATGGGTPCFHNNMEWMNEHGITIYIDADLDLLVERLRGTEVKRPLLQSISDLPRFIEEKRAERLPFYQQAQIIVKQDSNEDDIAQRIFDNLAQLLGH